jgi:hypothetical protein
LGLDAFSWAEQLESQTLLIQTDPIVGLTDEHFTRLQSFGRSCIGEK